MTKLSDKEADKLADDLVQISKDGLVWLVTTLRDNARKNGYAPDGPEAPGEVAAYVMALMMRRIIFAQADKLRDDGWSKEKIDASLGYIRSMIEDGLQNAFEILEEGDES